ncbi:MAG: NAD(P)-dependent glycerol-3-phosphate dehydrogenase [Oligoflexia bacterium]|nr:NAD(P)-dependent glycerol-3-phosphate dehydrogenase [Oligoflexia bacterium]
MTQKDFWRNSKVAVIGGGTFGTVLANLVARNCQEVRLYVRAEELARQINATRTNVEYLPKFELRPNVAAMSELPRALEGGVAAVIWALPSSVCREQARLMAPLFKGDEVLLHATKGIEQGTMKRISEILREELPCPRIGVISGPNLAEEIARGDPAATVVASVFDEVGEAGEALLANERFRIYRSRDIIGVEWAGTLKNILAIASGSLDALQYGWNARAMLITRGLAEIVRFGVAMGAREETFLSLAGVGDLLATCSSPLSRNYQVGYRVAKGEPLAKVLEDLGTTAEGVGTARSVHEFAVRRGIDMPITEAVDLVIEGRATMDETVQRLMARSSAK